MYLHKVIKPSIKIVIMEKMNTVTYKDLFDINTFHTIDSLLEKEKEKQDKLRQIFYQYVNALQKKPESWIIDLLLNQRKSLPILFRNKGLEGITFGYDSPETQQAFSQQPVYLPREEMNRLADNPQGDVLGAYDPQTDQIYLVDWLLSDPKAEEEVLFHERTHQKYPFWSEGQVRDYVRSQGYSRYH